MSVVETCYNKSRGLEEGDRMKKFLIVVLGLVLALGLALVGFGAYIESRSIDGTWQTENVKKLAMDNVKEEDIAGIHELGISMDQLIKTMNLSLEVVEDKATVSIHCQIDKELFKTALVDYMDKAIASELQKEGLTYDGLPEEAKQLIDKERLTDEAIAQQIAESFTAAAKEIAGTYDVETGMLTTELMEGTVDPVFNTIRATVINDTAEKVLGTGIEIGDFSKYTKNANTLQFSEDLQFKKVSE